MVVKLDGSKVDEQPKWLEMVAIYFHQQKIWGHYFDGFWGLAKSENGIGCFPLTHHSGNDGKIMKLETPTLVAMVKQSFGVPQR